MINHYRPYQIYVSQLITLWLCCYLPTLVVAQSSKTISQPGELGLPPITFFSPQDYDAGTYNNAIVQDERGIMYVGNELGVLEFDGANWRFIELANNSTVFSLERDAKGRIWVGGSGELGYLSPDSLGRQKFVSMIRYIPVAHRDFGTVWQIKHRQEEVFFNISDKLFRWSPGLDSMQVIDPGENPFHLSFVIDDTFYIRQFGVGLQRLEGDQLVMLPGGQQFADWRIYVLLPYDDRQLLVGTREAGFFLFDGKRFKRFSTQIDAQLQEHTLNLPGAVLPGGRFAFGTFSGGLFIMDREGRLVQQITREDGLGNNYVRYLHYDDFENLWLGLDRGVAHLVMNTPLSYFSTEQGLEGSISSLIRFQNRLYFGTTTGLKFLDPADGLFKEVTGIQNDIHAFLKFDQKLLAGGYQGLFEIKGREAIAIRLSEDFDFYVFYLAVSHLDPQRLFVGLDDGLAILQRSDDDQWEELGIVPGTEGSWIHTMTEMEDGNLWLGNVNGGVLRVQFPNWPEISDAEITNYGSEQGLPPEGQAVIRINDQLFTSWTSTSRYIPQEDRFVPDSIFGEWFIVAQENNDQLWLTNDKYRNLTLASSLPAGNYQFENIPFRPISNLGILNVYPENDQIVWVGTDEGLMRYNRTLKKDYDHSFETLIRQVFIGEDSLLSAGVGLPQNPILDYSDNGLRLILWRPFLRRRNEPNIKPGWKVMIRVGRIGMSDLIRRIPT